MATAAPVTQIDHALVGKPHTAMYLLHKWWARKPDNIVRSYIEVYSHSGEVVLDPFAGSGVTGIEAVRTNRRGLLYDIDPLAVFIARVTALPVDLPSFQSYARRLQDQVRVEIEKLYVTLCPVHQTEVPITHVIWADRYHCGNCGTECPRGDLGTHDSVDACPSCARDLNEGTKVGSEMLEIGYACDACLAKAGTGKRFLLKQPADADIAFINRLEREPLPAWIPDTPLFYPDGREFLKREDAATVADLFDRRALHGLSRLYEAILRIPRGPEREAMKLCFSSNLHSVSKLNMVHGLRWRKGALPSRAWVIHSFYAPPLRIEFPVWFYFAERVDAFLAGKKESNVVIPAKEARTVRALLEGKGNFCARVLDAVDLRREVPDDSVDYVFTDPPYGGAIQYLELSMLYMAWLRGPDNEDFEPNFKDEVTINANQGKDFDYYHKQLRAAFDNVFRVLKPGRYMTVTFHSTDIKVWNSILEAIGLAGFELEKIVYQPPPVKSIKAMMQPYGSAIGDYYIRYRKPTARRAVAATPDKSVYERVILGSARRTIAHRGEPTPLTIILNGIVPALSEAGALLSGATPIADVLKGELDKSFVLVDAVDDSGKVVGKKWWFKDPSTVAALDRVPLDERVEKAVLDVLRSGMKIEFDDILRRIFERFPNALTPDQISITRVLREYGEPTSDGRWRLKPMVLIREGEHAARIRELAELGKKMGYKVHVGRKEQNDKSAGVRLGDLNDGNLPSLTGIPASALARIRQIDVIWYQAGEVKSAFEVENTTGITEALIRASNIPYPCRRYVILPDERAPLMQRKLGEPAFGERFREDRWEIGYYTPVTAFYERSRAKTDASEAAFRRFVVTPAAVDTSGMAKLFPDDPGEEYSADERAALRAVAEARSAYVPRRRITRASRKRALPRG